MKLKKAPFPGRPSASAASVLLTLFNSQLSGLNRPTADQNHIFVQQQLHNYEAVGQRVLLTKCVRYFNARKLKVSTDLALTIEHSVNPGCLFAIQRCKSSQIGKCHWSMNPEFRRIFRQTVPLISLVGFLDR